jgi:adiponectin receptor
MSLSVKYHTHNCHSEEQTHKNRALDTSAVALVNAASVTPIFYYGFYCMPSFCQAYLTALWLSNLLAALALMGPIMRAPKNAWMVPLCFAPSVLVTVPGVVHVLFLGEIDLAPFGLSLGLLVWALIFHVMKWPESMWPGKFDSFGNSQNIYHTTTLMAAILNFYGSLRIFHETQMSHNC